ncbi:MAG TPA: hypothetical protein VE961_15300 [Pyrinomonadaceae bacterium]|nr:hypothetical protein [Pyrinomonadaceae bacterium]
MKKLRLIHFAFLILVVFNFQTASAQFPKIPKISNPSQPKPQPTQTDSAQPTTGSDSKSDNATKSVPTEAAINKPSIQITLRTHRQYYRNGQADEETWSWSPRITYRVIGPIPAGGQLAVEFTLPSGKPWLTFNCDTKETKAGFWWETECGVNSADVKDEQASTETGEAGFKITLKNELEGTNKTLFAGKFDVEKFHVGVVDLPKFKNNFSYYVNYDWNLPIGYIYGYDNMDAKVGYPSSETEARFSFVAWFKGDPKNIDYGQYVAYLYYQGKVVADSAGGDKFGSTGCQITNAASYESPNTYCRRRFTVNATVWDKQPQYHTQDFPMYKNPGEYEIKVLENGKLARTAKFTMGPNGRLVETGIGPQNNLGTGRIVVPVQVLGDQDGQWNRNAYKTNAFFMNPLSGFNVP